MVGNIVTLFLIISMGLYAHAGSWEMRVCSDPNNLPYSDEAEQGFENRIAEIIADELDADLTYTWFPQRAMLIRSQVREGACDLVMGVNDGHPQLLTTIPYYRSSYVFMYPKDSGFTIESLDDPNLKDLRIGVQVPGGGFAAITPVGQALSNRGLGANLHGYIILGDYDDESPVADIIRGLNSGEIDVGVVWGPIAGYFAQQEETIYEMIPVTPAIEPPFLPMVYSISIGMRRGDEDFRDRLHVAFANRWDEIQAVLSEYGVPLEFLPAPRLTVD